MRNQLLIFAATATLVACGTAASSGADDDPICTSDACPEVGTGDTDADDTGDAGVSDDTEDLGGDDGGDVEETGDARETGTDTETDGTPDARDPDADAVFDLGPCGGEEPNPCGGCFGLGFDLGASCGTCRDGVWVCEGENALACDGAERVERDWWRDNDLDGFGDRDSLPFLACEPPAPGWIDNPDDCDDDDDGIHPAAAEVCDGIDQDCDELIDEPPSEECLDACCDDALVCLDAECVIRCDDGTRCGEEPELCCEGESICYAESCAIPGDLCTFTEDCALDEICEASLGICLPRDVVPPCEFVPPVGEFEPSLACRWTNAGVEEDSSRGDVVATPIVINLTDDDGDGVTDENDIPEIVFLTYNLGAGCCNRPSTIRIVSGECNDDGSMTTIASLSEPAVTNDSGLAAADLNGDGVAEIVAITHNGSRPQGTVAFTRTSDDGSTWDVLWHNETYPTWDVHTRGGPIVSISNIDAAGGPEIIIGNVVLNGSDGSLVWDGAAPADGSDPGGVGNNAFLGPSSAVGDVDLDGFMEIFAGNTLYEHDGTVRWTYEYTTNNSVCGGGLDCDGFNAIGNFDEDLEGELVAIRRGELFVWNVDGSLLWQATIPRDDCAFNESGPPTVADFDGDGFPEVGTASADFYVVLDLNDCGGDDWAEAGCDSQGVLWKVANQDCSSRATGSSVFDFEGDGRAEVVYADEQNFRIFDGETGAILFDDSTHGSHTRIEMPVIADVDNDGNSEVVIPENGSNGGRPGIDVWEDGSDNWVRTRRIWNQHGYSVTNINEDGTVPLLPERNWMNPRLNNYRQNTQPGGIFDAPNLAITALRLIGDECPLTEFRVIVEVTNLGALSVPAGVPIQVFVDAEGEAFGLDTILTATRLFPGDIETISFDATITDDVPPPPYTVRATIDPDEEINECDESDNSRESEDFDCYPFP